MVARAFDLVVARTGLTAAQAQASGYAVRAPMIRAVDISHYFPGAAPLHVKLAVDEKTGRLLGGQIVGRKGVAKRIDVLATALHHRLTVAGRNTYHVSPVTGENDDRHLVFVAVRARIGVVVGRSV
jgi:NADPH-dependent 2,4-dienoyl-CoA reductase/sulfur reductase-like enzyme